MYPASRAVAAVATALLLLLAGCTTLAATDAPTGSPATDVSDVPTVHATGAGSVAAAPDEAVVSLTVTALEPTAGAARERVAADASAVRTALADAGVHGDAVETTAYSLRAEYDYARDGRELLGYRASQSLEVTVAPDRAGTVVDAAVGAATGDSVRVEAVRFGLTDATTATLRSDALALATENARDDADTVAGAAGLAVDGIRSLSVDAPVDRPVVFERAETAADTPTTFTPGDVTVTARVSAVYTASPTGE
jgi:hypothetical protein